MRPHRVFFYAPQRDAINAMIAPMLVLHGLREVVAVDSAEQVMGLEDEIFISVDSHPCRVPVQIEHVLRAQGFTRWRLDDSANRDWYKVRHGLI